MIKVRLLLLVVKTEYELLFPAKKPAIQSTRWAVDVVFDESKVFFFKNPKNSVYGVNQIKRKQKG
jgi:hypothetical protein